MKLAVNLIIIISGFLLISPVFASENFEDLDGDGLSNKQELEVYYTDPENRDTDGDGYFDDVEIKFGYSPLHSGGMKLKDVDSDKDDLNDEIELSLGTNIFNSDTDKDGYKDGVEVFNGYNPLSKNGNRDVKRHVEVDLDTQKFHYFFNDVLIDTFLTSTGRPGVPTPNGEFEIIRKLPSHLYAGANYYYPNTKWNLEFKRSYYIHTAYWHNDFGRKPRSGGCVNLKEENAEKIYRFLDVGDKVVIYGKTPSQALY